VSPKPEITVVIPTYRSTQHITETLAQVARECAGFGLTEIVVVDDGSNDGTFKTALETLRSLDGVSHVVVELAKNVGQTPTTAVGLCHASGDMVITMDDDLSYPPKGIEALLQGMNEDVDFVVGAPAQYANSRLRGIASKLARWMAVRSFGTPKDFIFSSFVLYRRDFLDRVDIQSCNVSEIGWMFRFTKRYTNAFVPTQRGLRTRSHYNFKTLFRTARPFLQFLSYLTIRSVRWASSLLVVVSLLMAAGVTIRAFSGFEFLPGFPSIVIAIMFNISISSLMLASTTSMLSELRERRRSSVFQLQRRILRG